jgi:hypothetical protein
VNARHLLALALVVLGAAGAEAQARHTVPAPQRGRPRPKVHATPKQRRKPKPKAIPAPTSAKDTAHAVANAARSAMAATPEVSVTLVTFGPGDAVWERFGHNALWIHDEHTGTDVAYNWGLFDFDQPDFVKRFLSGDTKYWMGGEDAIGMVAAYHGIGRPITLQRLNLTQAQAESLRDFVRWNAEEENKFYRYDYFRDNCSTRLRDAVDRALDGQLRRATDTVSTALTYRSESLRLTDGDVPIQTGIDVALGRPADVPLTQWESFFIPMRLRDGVRRVRVPTPDGGTVPLVADERTIAPTGGTPAVIEAREPPDLLPRFLILGLLLALLVLVLRVMMRSRRGAAWGLALVGALWSLVCGALGTLLIYMWIATKHVFWRSNENLLLLSPLSLLLVVLVFAALLRGRGVGKARVVGLLVAAMGLVALALALTPGGQDNLPLVALFLPVHLALAASLGLPLSRRTATA